MRKILFSLGLVVLLCGMVSAQTVSVDPGNASPDNITTFNSLQEAIHSFQVTGATNVNGGTTTDGAGLGVNHGNAAADIINITTPNITEEIVRIDVASATYAVTLDEALVINGVGAGSEPSAANNSIVALGSSGDDIDALVIQQDVDITINNLTFIASDTLAAGGQLVKISPASVGSITGTRQTVTFSSCVFTSFIAGASDTPIVQSKADAYVDNRASIGEVGLSDAFLRIAPEAGEHLNVVLEDCVLSHMADYSSAIFEVAAASSGLNISINSSVITYNFYYGIRFYGSGVAGDPDAWSINLNGTDAGAGLATGIGGPSVLLGNLNHQIRSQLGPNSGRCNITNTIMDSSNGARCLSGDADALFTIDGSILYGNNVDPLIVDDQWDDAAPVSWTDSTFANGVVMLGDDAQEGGAVDDATNTVRNCIFYRPGENLWSVLYTGNYTMDLDYCGLVGTNNTLPGTIIGANIITDDPVMLSTDSTSASFMDVDSTAYATGNDVGGPLAGGADYIGGTVPVSSWTQY